MNAFSPLFVLAAAGALSIAPGRARAVDTSQWKCETCPFEKEGRSVTVEVGAGAVSDASSRFGDFTGLQRKGGFLVLGGSAQYRGEGGLYGRVAAADLGLDVRSLEFDGGREGLYTLRMGYAETPRHLHDGAMTPFLGTGGADLSLPAGYPAVDTAAMPLASTLRPIDVGAKRSRLDASFEWIAGDAWSTRVSLRRDVRDGTQRLSGSFFSSASHLVVPVDQVTDQLEVATAFAGSRLQASMAYQVSLFRNDHDGLTWSNPFTPVVAGADRGQLALAPDNQFHQVLGSAAYEVTPWLRASGDIAFGRSTQDAGYLAATLNPNLAAAVPVSSLQGKADTFNTSVRLTASPSAALRLHASYARDVRDNRTPRGSYPAVSTDMFLDPVPRTNQPFSFTQDRFKLSADYRGPGSLRTEVGFDEDDRERTLQEVVTTRESTLWGRVRAQPLDTVSVALKLAHARRDASTYGIASWITPPENPLLRKFNLAERRRDSAALRADATIGEAVNVGFGIDYAKDDYNQSTIGLLDGRSVGLGADLSAMVSDQTQAHGFVHSERIRSNQAGSQVFAAPDWSGRNDDRIEVLGLGLKHTALKGRLELGADAVRSRLRNDVSVDALVTSPPFPTIRTTIDSLRLRAVYRLQDNLSLVGQWWYERYQSQDWHLDGVLPGTVSNLLAFGEQPPRYTVHVVQLSLRYRF
jgi:MtrB/PioB family decaheme-associated outer membrane protein